VCTTELAEVARLKGEWDKRSVKPIGLSVDPTESHKGWEKDIEETQGQALNFPVLADADRKVSELYGMIHPSADPAVTVRTVFVIDPANWRRGPPASQTSERRMRMSWRMTPFAAAIVVAGGIARLPPGLLKITRRPTRRRRGQGMMGGQQGQGMMGHDEHDDPNDADGGKLQPHDGERQ
jgi:AhpC/TSA family